MNTLSGTKIYTIGNLEYGSFKEAESWRDKVKEKLEPLNIKILSPLDNLFKTFTPESEGWNKKLKEMLKNSENWDFVHKETQKIRNRDLAMVDRSDFIICVLDITKPTYGTTDEIITAKKACKPVFLVIPESQNVVGGYASCPIWLCSYFKPNWVYSSLEEVIEKIYDINNKPAEELNNKYWKILL